LKGYLGDKANADNIAQQYYGYNFLGGLLSDVTKDKRAIDRDPLLSAIKAIVEEGRTGVLTRAPAQIAIVPSFVLMGPGSDRMSAEIDSSVLRPRAAGERTVLGEAPQGVVIREIGIVEFARHSEEVEILEKFIPIYAQQDVGMIIWSYELCHQCVILGAFDMHDRMIGYLVAMPHYQIDDSADDSNTDWFIQKIVIHENCRRSFTAFRLFKKLSAIASTRGCEFFISDFVNSRLVRQLKLLGAKEWRAKPGLLEKVKAIRHKLIYGERTLRFPVDIGQAHEDAGIKQILGEQI